MEASVTAGVSYHQGHTFAKEHVELVAHVAIVFHLVLPVTMKFALAMPLLPPTVAAASALD